MTYFQSENISIIRNSLKTHTLIDFNNMLFFADCESLIRKMLVLEPSKRYRVGQIKRHRWMQVETPPASPIPPPTTSGPNEQILRLMQSLGIDSHKTREVSIIIIYVFS